MIQAIIGWYLGALSTGGYALVAVLMALESSIVPIPSEMVIPPAAFLAVSTGNMSLAGLVLASTVGSWCGASMMYVLTRFFGRPLILRFGRYVLLTPQAIERAERWATQFGSYGVFAARLLPVIRHLIGIPAGIARMHFGWYSIATLIGAAIWSSVLCWVGVTAGHDPALVAGNLKHVSVWILGILLILALVYWILVHRFMRHTASK
jgi:membrane protein DedA with SNARE-associated domain